MKDYRILISRKKIIKRVKELGKQISTDYAGKTPIILCMLKGAVYFFADLLRALNIPVTVDFVRISSYKNRTESGDIQLLLDVTEKVENKDVIIVEDIIDSGKTIHYFINHLKEKKPASIKVCTFLDKTERRNYPVTADYVGFNLPSGFVIGYGLDYAENYRELPFLAELLNE